MPIIIQIPQILLSAGIFDGIAAGNAVLGAALGGVAVLHGGGLGGVSQLQHRTQGIGQIAFGDATTGARKYTVQAYSG